ncbi:MAG: glycoside hydrolase family 130 protein [Prevotella sp.]|jgi:predicted GH43/DUF377 family glycosyl hydrolase
MKTLFQIATWTLMSLCVAMNASAAKHHPNSQKRWAWLGFERPEGVNPIISPDTNSVFFCPMTGGPMKWEESDTFNPAAAVIGDKVVVLYRAEDNTHQGIASRTSRIGYAYSEDGLHFKRLPAPVIYPGGDDQARWEVPGGCEDPRVAMTEDGTYIILYTQFDRDHMLARLGIATSRDLVTWKKYGSPFEKAYGGKYAHQFNKSASIVTTMKDGKQVIAKINGKYYMYWGENFVNVATSTDLINWTPMLNDKGELLKVMVPRKGYFDSSLTECGPPAILTDDGIILFYNGKNETPQRGGDKNYTAGAYCAGQALFDKDDPTHLIDRLDEPFFKPELSFEKSGQYPAGTVFIEGLVPFQGKWFLYYGCADSKVGVAVKK